MNEGAAQTEQVYRVIQLIGTDAASWEVAAANTIAEATKSIPDLRVAQVVEMDTVVADGDVRAFRVRLKVSYRVDRMRPGGAVKRYLLVANQTVGGEALMQVIHARIETGPSEFHVLVPATFSKEYAAARRLSSLGADPISGYTGVDPSVLGDTDDEGIRRANQRLEEALRTLAGTEAMATGEVGDANPMTAIGAVLGRGSFDEIILATLPASISKWLGMDLPSRVERRFHLPVTHVSVQV